MMTDMSKCKNLAERTVEIGTEGKLALIYRGGVRGFVHIVPGLR